MLADRDAGSGLILDLAYLKTHGGVCRLIQLVLLGVSLGLLASSAGGSSGRVIFQLVMTSFATVTVTLVLLAHLCQQCSPRQCGQECCVVSRYCSSQLVEGLHDLVTCLLLLPGSVLLLMPPFPSTLVIAAVVTSVVILALLLQAEENLYAAFRHPTPSTCSTSPQTCLTSSPSQVAAGTSLPLLRFHSPTKFQVSSGTSPPDTQGIEMKTIQSEKMVTLSSLASLSRSSSSSERKNTGMMPKEKVPTISNLTFSAGQQSSREGQGMMTMQDRKMPGQSCSKLSSSQAQTSQRRSAEIESPLSVSKVDTSKFLTLETTPETMNKIMTSPALHCNAQDASQTLEVMTHNEGRTIASQESQEDKGLVAESSVIYENVNFQQCIGTGLEFPSWTCGSGNSSTTSVSSSLTPEDQESTQRKQSIMKKQWSKRPKIVSFHSSVTSGSSCTSPGRRDESLFGLSYCTTVDNNKSVNMVRPPTPFRPKDVTLPSSAEQPPKSVSSDLHASPFLTQPESTPTPIVQVETPPKLLNSTPLSTPPETVPQTYPSVLLAPRDVSHSYGSATGISPIVAARNSPGTSGVFVSSESFNFSSSTRNTPFFTPLSHFGNSEISTSVSLPVPLATVEGDISLCSSTNSYYTTAETVAHHLHDSYCVKTSAHQNQSSLMMSKCSTSLSPVLDLSGISKYSNDSNNLTTSTVSTTISMSDGCTPTRSAPQYSRLLTEL